MKDLDHTRPTEPKAAPAYEPPSLVIIGPLEEITLGSLSKNGDPGGGGLRNPA
jgi:hypothetical protein